jgi:hypothetical protein
MVELSKHQVQYILKDIHQNGIQNEDLALNLLDHICCILEEELDDIRSFETHYPLVFKRFFKKEMAEIEEETQLLLTFQNYYAMKNVMIKSGFLSSILFIIGAVLKIAHLPGAAALLLLAAAVFSLVFLPIFFVFKSKNSSGSTKLIIGSGVLFGIIFCIATLFKVMHWPGANLLWKIGLADLFFLFLPLYFFNGIRNEESKTNTILTSVMILMMGGMLFTLTNLKSTQKLNDAIDQNSSHMLLIQESTEVNPPLTSTTDSLCVATKDLISELTNDLLSTVSNIENKKNSLKNALYYYRENSEIVSTTFFHHNESFVSPNLQKLKTNLQAINQLINKKSKGRMFFTKESLNDTNWARNQFEGLPFFIVVERLQLINLEMNLLIERN